MKFRAGREAYSYKADPAVPTFDDSGPITFMDGECVLCTTGARLISRYDRAKKFKICRVQSPIGKAVLGHYGLDADDPESWLLLVDGNAYTSIDAMIRTGAMVGGVGWILQCLRPIPRPIQDWLYRRLARNRYRLWGRIDLCAIPDPCLHARLLE